MQYQGWGSLPQAFSRFDRDWQKESAELEELLTDDEYQAARASTQNAMYTPPAIVTAMWRALASMGFKGGHILEPSSGVGHFLGLQPGDLLPGSRRTAIEKDAITAAIAKALYPSSDVRHTPFEEALLPKNYFDVAIGNVPFGALFIHDKRYPKYLRQQIHDYFFVRSLDVVRPGGLVAFITTKGTMDKLDDKVRKYIAERADLVGAVRLNTASLPGTKVTTDILFFKKRAEKEPAGGESWVNSRPYAKLPGKYINEYFQNHPDMVLGTIKVGSLYGSGEEGPTATIVDPHEGFDLENDLAKALDALPRDVFGTTREQTRMVEDLAAMIPSPKSLPQGALFVGEDGNLRRAGRKGEASESIEQTVMADKGARGLERAKGLVKLRDALLDLLRVSADPKGDERLPELQKELNKQYDAMAKKGMTPLSSTANSQILSDDPITGSLLNSIEKIDPDTKKPVKGDIFTRRMLAAYERPTSSETASDALAVSLDETNRIDLDRIGELLGVPPDVARQRLVNEGLAYSLPGDQLIHAADYLSGPVRAKLREAEAAAKLDKAYEKNVAALKNVQPEDRPPSRIRPVLGAPWIPAEAVEDFLISMIGERFRRAFSIRRSAATGRWTVAGPSSIDNVAATQTYGTPKRNVVELIKDELNMRPPKVKAKDPEGHEYVDQGATDAADTKLKELRAHFETWLWGHKKWGPQLHKEFNEQFNDWVPKVYDGSHLTLPGSNPAIKFRNYQLDSVYRIISSIYNTLVYVAVGGGKTYIAAAAAMEAIRLGLARKVAIVVDRATLNQFIKSARNLYPGGQFVALSTNDLTPANRAKTLARVAVADKTVFIIPHQQFQMLPVSEGTLTEFYGEMLHELDEAIADAKGDDSKAGKRTIKQIEKQRDNLEARLKEKVEEAKKIASVPFEELGIDWIMYDEAHKVKNLMFATQIQSVRGLGNPAGNQITLDLYMKGRYVSRLQNGRGLTFFSGTPVNNSISEIYTMQRYLQPEALKEQGIRSFDDWVRLFAVAAPDMENVAGRYKFVTRLRKFRNLVGLRSLWNQITHVVPHEEVEKVVRASDGDMPIIAENSAGKRTYETVVREATPEQTKYRKVLDKRVRDIREKLKHGPPEPGDDIMLAVISDEKKAGLDMRLIYPENPEEPGNKLTAAAAQIIAVHKEFEKQRLTQLVFMNLGSPGSKMPFSTYADLIGKLVAGGIPREEIATISDAKTDAQREQLFEAFNRGDIRVLIGSMKKMGQGVNVQKKAIALHQLEPAWEPGTLVQMEGRIVRAGNENGQVRLYRYLSKGMSDEFMYSLLAAKQKVNNDFLSGKLDADEIEDVDIGTMAFQMAMAESSENKTVLEWTKAEQELRRIEGESRYHRDAQLQLRANQTGLKRQLENVSALVPKAAKFQKWAASLPAADPFDMTVAGKKYDKMTDAGQALLEILDTMHNDETRDVGFARNMRVTLVRSHAFGSNEERGYLSFRIPAEASEQAKFLEESGTRLRSQVSWSHTAPPTDRQLANWVSELMRGIDGVGPESFTARQGKLKNELAEMEAEVGKPFTKQAEMDKLRTRVATLSNILAAEAEKAANAAAGHQADDMGQGDEGEDDGATGGASSGGNFPPDKESLLPKNMSPEYRQWLRENWQHPVFGMGATSMGPPGPGTAFEKAWQTYADTWDRTVEKMKDMPTAAMQKHMDSLARLLYRNWKLTPQQLKAFDLAKGARDIGQEVAGDVNSVLDQIVQGKRTAAVGKPWSEEQWDVIRAAALAVLKGGHRKAETLPRDMQKVWKAHFGWVRHVSSEMTPRERRLEIEYQLQKVGDRIDELKASTLVAPMPAPAWDAFAIAEHRRILDVINGKEDYDALDQATKDWLDGTKAVIDRLTDEMLADPVVLEAAKGGGLVNFEEIVRMRRQSGKVYLTSLYHIVRDPPVLLNWSVKNLGPRLPVRMTKSKRAKDLWTVTLGSGQEMQFTDEQEAIDFAEQERSVWSAEYGESVNRRITVRDPLTEEQIEWLGPVEDLRVLAAKTIVGMHTHISGAHLFSALDLDAIDEKEYADLDESEKHKWRKVPDSPAFFRLAGKYVPEAVHYNLMDSQLAFTGIASELWSHFLNLFKFPIVVLNPATWFRNTFGQIQFGILAGLNPITHRKLFVDAARRLSEGLSNPTVYRLRQLNRLHGGIDKVAGTTLGEALRTPTNQLTASLGMVWNKMRSMGKEAGNFYQFLDHVWVVAQWIKDTEVEGLPEDLALPNLDYYQNYDRIGNAARHLRKAPWGDPFVSFGDQAIKIMLKGMREHPGRVMAMYAAPAMINLAARMVFGVTDEEMQILNTNPQRRSFIDRYFQPVLYRDSAGMVHTLDLRWAMALASNFRTGTGPGGIGIPFLFNQPIFGPAMDVLYNREKYSGRSISKEGEAVTAWEAAAHIAWESAPIPSIASRAPLRLYRAATGESGENFLQILLKEVFGVSIMPRYATKAEAYKLIREAIGEQAADRALKLIEAYNRFRPPGKPPITGTSAGQSYNQAARAAARRELQRN